MGVGWRQPTPTRGYATDRRQPKERGRQSVHALFLVANDALLMKCSSMKPLERTRISLMRRCATIALPMVLFVILWLVHWFYDPRISMLERQARQYAGWAGIGAVDCGVVQGDGEAGEIPAGFYPAIRKAASAYKQGKPFCLLYLWTLYDGEDAYVLMGTRTGRIFELYQGIRDNGRVVRPISKRDLSHLRDGDLETNLKRYLQIPN